MNSVQEDLKNTVRTIQDFPKPGISFKDITPVLYDAYLCQNIVFEADLDFQGKGIQIDAVAGIESRGFFFGFYDICCYTFATFMIWSCATL